MGRRVTSCLWKAANAPLCLCDESVCGSRARVCNGVLDVLTGERCIAARTFGGFPDAGRWHLLLLSHGGKSGQIAVLRLLGLTISRIFPSILPPVCHLPLTLSPHIFVPIPKDQQNAQPCSIPRRSPATCSSASVGNCCQARLRFQGCRLRKRCSTGYAERC